MRPRKQKACAPLRLLSKTYLQQWVLPKRLQRSTKRSVVRKAWKHKCAQHLYPERKPALFKGVFKERESNLKPLHSWVRHFCLKYDAKRASCPENVPVPVQVLIQPLCADTILCWTSPSCHKLHFFSCIRSSAGFTTTDNEKKSVNVNSGLGGERPAQYSLLLSAPAEQHFLHHRQVPARSSDNVILKESKRSAKN